METTGFLVALSAIGTDSEGIARPSEPKPSSAALHKRPSLPSVGPQCPPHSPLNPGLERVVRQPGLQAAWLLSHSAMGKPRDPW